MTGPHPGGAVVDADLVAAAVLGSPHVVALHGGRFGEVATYLPGRRVVGVRLRPDDTLLSGTPLAGAATMVEVHVVARYPATVTDIDTTVRAAVRAALAHHRGPISIAIRVEDMAADRPTIGGPHGDLPVCDLPPPSPPQVLVTIDPAPDTGAAPAPAPAPAEPVVVERVLAERVVTDDAVLERVVVEHTVLDPSTAPVDDPAPPEQEHPRC